MKGPFFAERDMFHSKMLCCRLRCCVRRISQVRDLVFPTTDYLPLLRRVTINTSVRLLLRVLYPRVGWPHGVTGCRPPEVLPSPPPCGWSTGFIVTPRLAGLIPFQRLRPALPMETFSWSVLPTWPIVAMHSTSTLRVSPEGSLSSA